MDTKSEEKVGFDLSALSLQELIDVYENIKDFLVYLNDSKIEVEEKGKDDNE